MKCAGGTEGGIELLERTDQFSDMTSGRERKGIHIKRRKSRNQSETDSEKLERKRQYTHIVPTINNV